MSSAKQKDSALNLAKFVDKKIIVKLSGGREGEVLKWRHHRLEELHHFQPVVCSHWRFERI
jgi:hypothetical protein